MKYVLVDKLDNIVDTKDLSDDVGVKGARTFFVGRKQIPYESFIQLWEIISDEEHESRVRSGVYKKLKSESNQYNKLGDGEFGDWLDMEKS